MKHQLGKITARDTARALREAEAQLVKPEHSGGSPVYVDVLPQDIGERLELFQPRRPGYGLRTLDADHVKRLATRIKRKGEIDPPLVVKLETVNPCTGEVDGHEWVVVDGHHRLAAYRKVEHTETIRCQWFAGSVRAAMDASVQRNDKINLPIARDDKAEAAWTRTLMSWNSDTETWSSSKKHVVEVTDCSDGTVAAMRRVVILHHNYAKGIDQDPKGKRLYTVLGPDLSRHSWNKVNRVRLDLTPNEPDADAAAAALAREMVLRLTNMLSKDPEVTAQALWLYDSDLCPKLVTALQARIAKEQRDEQYQAAEEELAAEEAAEEERRIKELPF